MKLTIFLICIGISIQCAFSQNVNEFISIPSPSVSSLCKSGEVPVSLFNGATNIQIPIYTLKEKDITIPIFLSYDATGVKPESYPGWVGMNWSLNAGGVITRIVKGFPDDAFWTKITKVGNTFLPIEYFYCGFAHNLGKTSSASWNSKSFIENLVLANGNNGYYSQKIDTEPDEFIFNFNGHSGKFYLNENTTLYSTGKRNYFKNLIVIGEPSIKVDMVTEFFDDTYAPFTIINYLNFLSADVAFLDAHIVGFKITDSDGTEYYYGYYDDDLPSETSSPGIDYSWDFFAKSTTDLTADSWHLRKIISPNGEVVNLNYVNKEHIASFINETSIAKKAGNPPKGHWYDFILSKVGAGSYSYSSGMHGRLMLTSYLSSITSNNANIAFSITPSIQKTYNYASVIDNLSQRTTSKSGEYSTDFIANEYGVYYETEKYHCGYFESRQNLWPLEGEDFQGYSYVYRYDDGSIEYIGFQNLKWYKLDKITISTNNEVLKEFSLNYSSNSNDRLRLLSVQESDKYGNTLPAYNFEYEDYSDYTYTGYNSNWYTDCTQKLPAYNSNSTDHWGYFNGADIERNNPSNSKKYLYSLDISLDNVQNITTGYKNFRDPEEKYLYAGILNKITYPTGGYTEFRYEPHKYSKSIIRQSNGSFAIQNEATEMLTGGLRIKKIENFDQNKNLLTSKNYTYSVGILNGQIKYFWDAYNLDICNYDVHDKEMKKSGDVYTAKRFVSHTVLPVSTNSVGAHIGYNKVTEAISGGAGGYTEYYFRNHEQVLDECFVATINNNTELEYTPFNSKWFQRGLLRIKIMYDASGKIIQKDSLIYSENANLAGAYIKAISTQRVPIFEDSYSMDGTAYKIYTYPYSLSRKEVYNYDSNGQNPVLQTTDFSYNSYNQTSQIKQIKSDASELKTNFIYPSDISLSAYYTYCNTQMDNIQKAYDIWVSHCNTDPNTRLNCIMGWWTQYPSVCHDASGDFLRDACLTNYQATHVLDAEASAIQTMIQKNMINTPIQKTTQVNSTTIAAEYYKFLSQNNLIVSKVSYGTELSTPVSTFANPYVTNTGALVKSNLLVDKVYYDKYDNRGNIEQLHKKDDANTSYIWGYNNTFLIAKAINAARTDIFYTGFEDAEGNSTNDDSHTGHKSRTNGYSKSLTGLSNGTYCLSYWEKISNVWSLKILDNLLVTTGTYPISITGQVDDVRFHPKSALMTTSTWDPLKGITSTTDENGRTTYYQYDNFGRLQTILDNELKLLKQMTYHYKQ